MNIIGNKQMIQPPQWMRALYGDAFWREKTTDKTVYLTFDDGPVPHPTPWVLDLLKQYNIKATFFCVGENIDKHPEIYRQLIEQKHSVGNHCYHHTKAFSVSHKEYFKDIARANHKMETTLFRPPHGQLYPWYMKELNKIFSKIVFWYVMPMDYDSRLTANDVFENVRQFVRPGSVVVFHDSLKAFDRLQTALPRTIEELLSKNYTFKTLSSTLNKAQ